MFKKITENTFRGSKTIKLTAIMTVLFLTVGNLYSLDRDNFSITFCVGLSWNYLLKKAFYESFPKSSAGYVDAASGATKPGFNTGVRLGKKVFEQC